MGVMFKGRKVEVGDTLWGSRLLGLNPAKPVLTVEYKVSETYVQGFSAVPQGETQWHEVYIDGSRHWDHDCYHWTKEDAEEDSRRCVIISDIEEATHQILKALETEKLWQLSAEKMYPAYEAMAALLLAIADTEQKGESGAFREGNSAPKKR